MATTNPLHVLEARGQSVWLDNLTRGILRDGFLRRLIEEDGISGVTSNPAIFEKAMTSGTEYDQAIRELADMGLPAPAIYEAMAVRDIQDACELLRSKYDKTNGTDGFVSLEVSPHGARSADATIEEARRLWTSVNRPNAFIKIPGTPEGVPAIQRCLAEGININITLLFSLEAHKQVMEAHLAALEERARNGQPLATVASVASFFLSRIDTMVDKKLDAMKSPEAKALRGRAAIASAKIAYQNWLNTYKGPRWESLRSLGARPQKPLWASTSTKDPAYPDVKYVETLIGPDSINTLPEQTIDAFRDHGRVTGDTILENVAEEADVLSRLEQLDISMKTVTDTLVDEGIVKFSEPYDKLIASLEEKRRALSPASR
ncbi:MAG TPA: transaldolase [Dongiaceae bacterium]|nr:transaldolase [Dongiaceae bacterium]